MLGVGIERAGIAAPFSDPVGQVRAEDESTYANSAQRLVEHGDGLTPKALGRYFLYKPPLLVWLVGFSLKLFGQSLLALRLPALVAAVLATLCMFNWVYSNTGIVTGCAVILLLLSSPLWHTFARLCYTEKLLLADPEDRVTSAAAAKRRKASRTGGRSRATVRRNCTTLPV